MRAASVKTSILVQLAVFTCPSFSVITQGLIGVSTGLWGKKSKKETLKKLL